MASIASQLESLSDLLRPKDEDDNSDNEIDTSTKPSFTPANIGPAKKTTYVEERHSKDIWNEQEIPESAHVVTDNDPRPVPEYEMLFKQAVSSEDMFLQMGNKNPSTASCEDIVVKIHLPNTEYKDVDLDVTNTFLDCRTPTFKLGLDLPYKVDSANGKAQWNKDKQLLTVTLRLVRDLDFLYS